MTTQYCVSAPVARDRVSVALTSALQSQECQKSHWASHKQLCQHTSGTISAQKQSAMGAGFDEDVVKGLRKFTSAHQTLLSWAGFQAMQLKRMPSNIRQQALLIELNYRSSSDSLRR